MAHRTRTAILILVAIPFLALSAKTQQKPFTQDQVQGIACYGLGDETRAKAIASGALVLPPGKVLSKASRWQAQTGIHRNIVRTPEKGFGKGAATRATCRRS